MTALRANHNLRYYDTDDGEPYWTLSLFDVLDIVANELAAPRRIRGLNLTTGEIVEGEYLQIALGHALAWVDAGNTFKFEVIE